jgi:hypothetical protein
MAAARFREAARIQGRCQNPDCLTPHAVWCAHHAIYRMHLKQARHDQFDVRAALRLCIGCHAAYHQRTLALSADVLPECVGELACELFGPEAGRAYLARYYAARSV